MRVSLSQIKQYLNFDLPPVDELVKRINQQLGGVEEIIDLGVKYKDPLIVKVVECEKHQNADKLSVCKIDDGGKSEDVPRDDNGLVQVVCGASNVHADMLAVWLPPRSVVPASFDDKHPFVLESKELRGVISNGMLASARELALGDEHDGILEITEKDIMPQSPNVQGQTLQNMVGQNFAKVFGLDDVVIDIENKMFTHRPDCFGQLGVAREVAGILGHKFTTPIKYLEKPIFEIGEGLELEIINKNPDKSPRFLAVAIKNVEVKPSSLWLQCALIAMGAKPINNIVDATNYVMLLTAQPTHAYDYDKLYGHKLEVRMAIKGEKATLLNGKTYEMTDDDLVIADDEGVVSLAGIMGGMGCEVTNNTKNIVLECANFDMYAIRKSSMRHGLFTDASARFNKAQSPLQNNRILSDLINLILTTAGADSSIASRVFDVGANIEDELVKNDFHLEQACRVGASFINARLGIELKSVEIKNILVNVEFKVDVSDDELNVYVPLWRTDIEIPEDIVEEVGRLYGFDKIPKELPLRPIRPVSRNAFFELKAKIRQVLTKAGANEILSYSFVNEKLLESCGQDKSHAYQLSNALSPDLQFYRLSLMPSLLTKVQSNIKAGFDKFALFELGKAHIKDQLDDESLPREDEITALVVATSDRQKNSGAPFYLAKRYLEGLIQSDLSYLSIPEDMREYDITKPYDLDRTAFVYADKKFIGIIGEFRPEVRQKLKLPAFCAGFELDTNAMLELIGESSYQPLSRFPNVTQDISLRADADIDFGTIKSTLKDGISSMINEDAVARLDPIDIYQKGNEKHFTFRLNLVNYDRTLNAVEVNDLLDVLATKAKETLGVERI